MSLLALERITVLIVDDDQDICFLQAVTFELQGATVSTVTSVQEAIRLLPEIHPDLVICDLKMPKQNGFDLMAHIQSLSSRSSIKVIAVSGLADQATIQKASAAGFDAYLTKPAPPDELIPLVQKLLDPNFKGYFISQ